MSSGIAAFEHEPPGTFRGSRDYVHSTDVYEEIVAGAAAAGLAFDGPVDLRIRSRMTRRPVYLYSTAGSTNDGEAAATCTFASGAAGWQVGVYESEEVIRARAPYDESPAGRLGRIDGMAIALDAPTGLRPIECVTALAVALHKSALPPPDGKRWFLAQLSLSRPLIPRDAERMRIGIDKVVGRTMTRSTLRAHEGDIGRMVFILG